MAYGRLDVFWPDGQFKTFPLVENNISVGRSSGNSIALDTTTISRYHFSISHDGQQVALTDLESVNGTFVDGERLNQNEPRLLFGGEEIQIGHLRLIYHQIDEMPTQPMKPLEENTQRIEVESPTFRVDVISPDQPFSPGAHMSAEVSISNTGTTTQRYRIEVSGMPAEWIRVDRPELELDAGDSAQVLVNFRPARRSDSKPGDYPVTVHVSLKERPETALDAHFTVRVLPFSGFGMALENITLANGERFRLHLHNQGSSILPLTIGGQDKEQKLRYTITPPKVALQPGQRLVVQGEIKPLKPALVGSVHQHPFDLVVRANDASRFLASVRGQYVERPLMPTWMPFALGISGIVGLLFLVLIASFLLRPAPEPHIASFLISSTQVAQGDPLGLTWAVTEVADLSVQVNGTPVITQLGTETTGLNLDTALLSGDVVVQLVGVNGSKQTTASQTVRVYQALGEGYFTVEPPQLVRHVVQNLNVSWNIPGAVKTRISGLESFNNNVSTTDYGAEATITGVPGVPNDTLHLTLYAEDEVGNSRQQTLDVPVVNPECVPAGGPVTLFVGPDARHQVVGTVPSGAFVTVDAQDTSGQWLRMQLPGGLSGWGVRSEFSCARTFNVADLVKELNVPTVPPPSPTIPATATAVPRATSTATPTTTATVVPTIAAALPTSQPAQALGAPSASPDPTAAG